MSPAPACDNPRQFSSSLMRVAQAILIWLCAAQFGRGGVRPQAAQNPPAAPASIPLVLAGGTVIDVTDWGRSAKDLANAVVVIQDGRITDVGPRAVVAIPPNARIIDCTGKYLIPGLI